MTEMLYSVNGVVIALAILALMVLAMHACCFLGMASRERVSESSKDQINTIQASLLGMLALLLGFTFAIALERFGGRSSAIVHEANAIGTAYLRTSLLPEAVRADSRRAVRDYTDLRARMAKVTGASPEARTALRLEAVRTHDSLWALAVQAARLDPNPVTTGLFVQSLNEMIDAYASTVAEVDRHVPEFVLFLLYGAFVVSGGVIGYASGLAGHRPARVTYLMVVVIALLLYMVMDLDRPGRGVIRVSVQSLLDLQAGMKPDVP
jgi:uncharacterized membrane protein (Fun14 family)